MFCTKCGAKLAEDARFCSSCGSEAGSGADAAPADEEFCIKEGLCNRVKSRLFVENGHAMLTNKRFVYSRHSLAKIAAMGVLVNLTKGAYDFDIPVESIACLKEGRQGISKTLIICTGSGEEYNFYLTDRQQWEAEIRRLMNN